MTLAKLPTGAALTANLSVTDMAFVEAAQTARSAPLVEVSQADGPRSSSHFMRLLLEDTL